jgi:hypothetical protein
MEEVTTVTATCPFIFPSISLVITTTGEYDQKIPAIADPSAELIVNIIIRRFFS